MDSNIESISMSWLHDVIKACLSEWPLTLTVYPGLVTWYMASVLYWADSLMLEVPQGDRMTILKYVICIFFLMKISEFEEIFNTYTWVYLMGFYEWQIGIVLQ